MLFRISLFFICLNLASCTQHYFYVQQEKIDRNFLASSHIGTPDPRQENPTTGQRLLIRWNFPSEIFAKNLSLVTTVRFWDDQEVVLTEPIQRRTAFTTLFFASSPLEKEKRILTYRVQAISSQGEVVGWWEHPLWTPLISLLFYEPLDRQPTESSLPCLPKTDKGL